jgi:hypothetical protein
VGAKRDLIQFDFLDLLTLKSGAASEVIILANCFLLWIVRARARLCLSVVRFLASCERFVDLCLIAEESEPRC